jgi:hypothetical protein
MTRLVNKTNGRELGEISERELEFLIDMLEEEGRHDRDYYIDAPTVDFLARQGASTNLITLLRRGLGAYEGFDVQWEDDSGAEFDESIP